MNSEDQGYLKNLKISAFIAIGLDLIVGISSGVLVWRYSNMKEVYENSVDKLGPLKLCRGFGRFKFILFDIIVGFGMPLIDTCTGKSNHSDPMIWSNFIILDAWYYGRIETKSYLVHMDHSVIIAMAVFVYIAIVKDALVGYLIYYVYKCQGMDFL